MHTHEIIFTIRLDKQTHKEMGDLSEKWRCSKAETLRRLVQNAHGHFFGDVPKCADGGRCFVPQMHQKKAST